MAYVVTENCINCKYGDCVEVCPVDCFHEGPNFLVIDPEECIDCSLCVAECPAEAIFAEDDVPAEQFDFIADAFGNRDCGNGILRGSAHSAAPAFRIEPIGGGASRSPNSHTITRRRASD